MKIKKISYHCNYHLLLGHMPFLFGSAFPSRNQIYEFIYNDASLMQAALALSVYPMANIHTLSQCFAGHIECYLSDRKRKSK
jgi:hypothetical protein